MIKLKDLLFEQTKTEQLPAVTFGDNFQNNYITVTGDWEANANLVIKQIQDELAKGKTLEDLTIKVYGGASNLPATNRWDNRRNANPPNHSFGGLLRTPPGWVTKFLPNGKERPKGGAGGYINIDKGNPWLAGARAEALKKILVPYISRAVKSKFDNVEVAADPVTSGSTKSARAVVTSAVKSPDQPLKDQINKYLRTTGGGYSRPYYFLPGENPMGHKNGHTLTFNWQLLSKASKEKERIGSDPTKTFQGTDFGAGPGVSVYLSKDAIEKARKSGDIDYKLANRYGGDPADYEQSLWKMFQYGKSEEGKNNQQLPSNYKKPINLDKRPDGKPWQYINPNNGKIIVKRPIPTPLAQKS